MLKHYSKMTTSRVEQLILAMAPIDDVLAHIQHTEAETASEEGHLRQQDKFSELLNSCWAEMGPSQRYIKAVIRAYVARLDEQDLVMESDALMDLVFRASVEKETPPDPNESCYQSFLLPVESQPLVKIRVYPYHNDVSLRLWEAGATLAEYFLANRGLVNGKSIFELGAGVGLTGLVAAACGAKQVYLTDCTEACRANMAHNILINQDWLHDGLVAHGYLEWSSFIDRKNEIDEACARYFHQAEILIGADVAYLPAVLPYLVAVVVRFLRHSPNKKAFFGITRRNMETFDTFLTLLEIENIKYQWVWNGMEDEPLPLVFPGKFIQERTDVRIASLSL